jgi:transketolase
LLAGYIGQRSKRFQLGGVSVEVQDSSHTIEELENRSNLLRQRIMMTVKEAGGGHVGGSLSAADLLTALYLGGILRVDPTNPQWEERDRFVLSKGHASVALCSVLAAAGFFPLELLNSFNKLDSPFAMHPNMHEVPGVDMSTGALGHGLSVGVGLALAARIQGRKHRVFVMLGDGEICEGSVWEAAMSAAHYHLDSLTAIIDRNGLSIDGSYLEVMNQEPLADKWRAFGWEVREIDGHDMSEIMSSLTSVPFAGSKPSMIIAHTIKGKGLSFAENQKLWHYQNIDQAILERALEELRTAMNRRQS